MAGAREEAWRALSEAAADHLSEAAYSRDGPSCARSERGGAPALVLAGRSKLIASDVRAPEPFGRTPLDRFTAIVTETGPMSPGDAVDLARRFTVDPRIGAA